MLIYVVIGCILDVSIESHDIPSHHFNLSSYKSQCRYPADFDRNPFVGSFIDDIIVTRYKPGSVGASSVDENCAPHRFLRMFDWTVYMDAKFLEYKTDNPRTVFVFGSSTAENFRLIEKYIPVLHVGQKRSLVIGGSDIGLRRLLEYPSLQKFVNNNDYFTDVWIESKDIIHDKVKTFPMGLRVEYITRAGWKVVSDAVATAQQYPHPRPLLVNAVWGKRFPHLDSLVGPRIALIKAMQNWTWVSRSMWDYEQYWQRVPQYRFSICPAGAGVQSPKIFECLVLQSVPVVTALPAFQDLKALGFPVVLVQRWYQLSEDLLLHAYEHHIRNVSWERVNAMLKPENAMQLLLTGSYDFLDQ